MTARRTASETSPLLPKGKTLSSEPAETPNRILSNTNYTNIHAQEDLKSINEEQGKSNGEENNDEQYQGLPEVKKQLRYIIPAVAIGVRSNPPFREMEHELKRIDLLSCL